MMHNAVAHHLPTRVTQPEQWLPLNQLLLVLLFSTTPCIMGHPFGQGGAAVLVVFPPSSLLPPSQPPRWREAEVSLT